MLVAWATELVEQPLPREMYAGLAELRGRVSVPIMVDESMWDNKECAVVIRAGAADVANVYVHESGGVRAATPHHSPVACVYAHSHSRLTRTHTGRCCKRAETSPSAKQLASLVARVAGPSQLPARDITASMQLTAWAVGFLKHLDS